ncbi:ribose-phosphate diphosphokinase [Ascoidea rubescens DSM 1968]|uniref:ribose-phosphate diphosphokinase n=1 Tax=Ascoidea rubescens DSM 1968 TaxID=1344418 RepID=A0A1D2VPE6_9ASCO|nr:phosphoribosyl pyrophosphokinase [Ascoidea rubescens DSM 1968]ODV63469.1 phosphoribosyl pyrophosphokinase [Ascoidea rubescens DSM 1968]
MRKCKVFVGLSHPELGAKICEKLDIQASPCSLNKFSNGETSVQINCSVRDNDVYIIQSSSDTINDHIMELLVLISACKGGSASKITVVVPNFPYSTQSNLYYHSNKDSARMLANLIVMAGADHVVSMDLHAGQIQGFFNKPVDNLYALPFLVRWIKTNVKKYEKSVIISKNANGTKRVTEMADSLNVNFAMIQILEKKRNVYNNLNLLIEDTVNSNKENSASEKTRFMTSSRIVQGHVLSQKDNLELENQRPAELENTNPSKLDRTMAEFFENYNQNSMSKYVKKETVITLVGNVKNRPAIILDDMVTKPEMYISISEHLRMNCGAECVYLVATHGVFLDSCLEALFHCQYLDKIVVTNTCPLLKNDLFRYRDKLVVIDVSSIFAEYIRRAHFGESISTLFDNLFHL